MDAKHITDEHLEVSCMEHTHAAELIRQLKQVKATQEITYPRILDRLEGIGHYISLTTLRRVFAEGSENNAASFNYESTLLPIAEVLLNAEDRPTPDDSPYAKEIDALKAVIRVQNEEIARLHDIKEHLDERVVFLISQISLKDKRMDEKDEIIKRLMDRCL